jgi:hypothetical protein
LRETSQPTTKQINIQPQESSKETKQNYANKTKIRKKQTNKRTETNKNTQTNKPRKKRNK